MPDLTFEEATKGVSLIDENTGLTAKIDLVDGEARLITGGVQSIESLKGFDPIADVWFYFGTENDSQGVGSPGDEVRVQIAAGDDSIAFPAIDLTYTIQVGDVDEETAATNLASYLNSDSTFSTLWRAQKVSNSGVVYITARKPGSQFERPNVNDFQVSATGTTTVTAAFQNIIRRNKVTSLARDPSDPRQGILGIQGSVVQTEGDVTNRFQTVFSDLRVDGSVTPVTFMVPADATEVKFVSKIVFAGQGNGIKFGQFLSKNSLLTNGILVSFKSNDFSASREAIKSTEDFLDFHAEDPARFALFIQSGGDKFSAVLDFGSPLELRPQGEFTTDDFLMISIRDDLTSGIAKLRAIVSGFNREF